MASHQVLTGFLHVGLGRVLCLALLAVLIATPVRAAQEAATPTAGGTLVVSVASNPGHFNPAITTGFTQHVVADSLLNGLVWLDEQRQPLPDLADRWTVSEDGKTYTFNLHPGVRWHDLLLGLTFWPESLSEKGVGR